MEPRLGKRERTRAHIIDSTRSLLKGSPWSEITLDALADEADVVRSTVVSHFGTKGEILKAVLRDALIRAKKSSDDDEEPVVDHLLEELREDKNLTQLLALTYFKIETTVDLEDEFDALYGILHAELSEYEPPDDEWVSLQNLSQFALDEIMLMYLIDDSDRFDTALEVLGTYINAAKRAMAIMNARAVDDDDDWDDNEDGQPQLAWSEVDETRVLTSYGDEE